MPADAVAKLASAGGWQIASCGAGSTGDRRYQWAWLATASPRHFLLIRRSLRKPAELAYFYCWVPHDVPPATLRVLTAVTGRRWTIEEDHQFGKDHFGYDHFQTRLHTPILRHPVLVMAALAVCAITCAQARTHTAEAPTPTSRAQPPPTDIGLIPLTRHRDQTPVQPRYPHLAIHQPPSAPVRMAPPTPSTRPLVPPPSPTHMIKSRSTAAPLLRTDDAWCPGRAPRPVVLHRSGSSGPPAEGEPGLDIGGLKVMPAP